MKRILYLIPVLFLAACDKPTASVELECRLSADWQKPVSMLRDKENYKNLVPVQVDLKAYQDRLVLVVDGKESSLQKTTEEKYHGEFGRVHMEYRGIFPGTDQEAIFSMYGDVASKAILQFNLAFVGEHGLSRDGVNLGVGYSCDPIKKEYKGDSWSAIVPWNHGYKMPNKIEKCINTIGDLVYCDGENCDALYVSINEGFASRVLTAEEAVKISPNWDYSNMRVYVNDGKLEEHEKDACEVVDRLLQFIDEQGLNNVKIIEDALEDCGVACEETLATGESGDYLIRLPATDALLKVANKAKNSKFLSVFNPNSYAKDGYCLLNIVPYDTMEKLGWQNKNCYYRIYCGAPEFLDYDQHYAVEVCY